MGGGVGAATLFALDRFLPHEHERLNPTDYPGYRRGLLLFADMTLHNFPEGLAVGTSYAAQPRLGFLLALAVLAAGINGKVYASAVLAVPLVYIMSFMRDSVRSGYLKPHFSPESLQVLPQYSPMFLFFFVLVAGIAAVVWMLRKALASLPQAEEEQ